MGFINTLQHFQIHLGTLEYHISNKVQNDFFKDSFSFEILRKTIFLRQNRCNSKTVFARFKYYLFKRFLIQIYLLAPYFEEKIAREKLFFMRFSRFSKFFYFRKNGDFFNKIPNFALLWACGAKIFFPIVQSCIVSTMEESHIRGHTLIYIQ